MTYQTPPVKDCPTPAKARFATDAAAMRAATRPRSAGVSLRAYMCECGWVHLTSRPAPPVPVQDDAVTADVLCLSDAEFQVLVAADCRGQVTPEQAAALRTVRVVGRWGAALKVTLAELERQFADRASDGSAEARGWRQRANGLRSLVRERQVEARELQGVLQREAIVRRAAGLTGAQARAAAGDVAVHRLIDAHRAEFGDLLAEEFERAGLEVPARVARHVARNAAVAS